uniref:NADH:ubiquinone reductase (H(+)-translocating) n=1 Tax=Colobopsis nipponica TaxID=2681982 RepID=A0A7S6XWS9_9HYME|nr:NADH dehydrogenase subunit 5 [Colobopsis nipponica]QOW83437.1 NADH dehydrogenase subunit 5 [Colobopsis nipponica]
MNLYIYFYYMMMVSLVSLFMSMYLYFMDLSIILEWMIYKFNSINIEFLILLDWISCVFISIVMMISAMIMLYSMIYMQGDIYINRFMKLVVLFICSMVLMILSPNLVSILFGWDGLGLSSYCLVIYYQNYLSYNSGMVTVLCNRIGDIGLLMSISLIYMYGSWNMLFELKDCALTYLIMFMIMLGALTKSAQIPFSVWLPMAMAAPTPVSALVHSSTLVTAGIYLLIRFNMVLMENILMSKLLLYLATMTMFMAGLMANFEIDLKKIIALSTLSQLGLMMMILSVGGIYLSFYHLLTHAVFKSLLFMCAGIMIHCMNNNQDIRFYGKLNEFIPFTMMSFYISNMALMGFPFFAGFYSKDLIMELIFTMKFNLFMMFMILLSIMLTISYSLRLMFYTFFNEFKSGGVILIKENFIMNLSMFMLMNLSVMSGSMFFWMFFFDMYFIYVKGLMKCVMIGLMVMGGSFMVFMYMKNLMCMYMLTYFFSSMWMMNLMYLWIYKPFLFSGLEFMKMEKDWFEFFGKNILLNYINKLIMNNNIYKIYMFMMLIMVYLMIIFLLV